MGVVHFRESTVDAETLTVRGGRAAQSLGALGVGPEDAVAMLLRNEPVFIEALSCVRSLQATRVLLPWPLDPVGVGRVLDEVNVRVLIGHLDLLLAVAPVLRDRPNILVVVADLPAVTGEPTVLPDRQSPLYDRELLSWDALIARANGPLLPAGGARHTVTLTSGSTGRPKVVRRPGAQRWTRWYRYSAENRPAIRCSMVTAPLFNSGQFGVFSQTWHHGADQILLPEFQPEAFLAAVERYRVNHAYLIPAMFVQLLKLPAEVRDRYDVSSLNYVVHTGGPCPPDIKERMIDWWGPVFWEAYGCSETSLIAECSSSEWLVRRGTVGKPIVPVTVLDECGGVQPPGVVGRIFVDLAAIPTVTVDGQPPPAVTTGAGRSLPTGDLGYLDADGYLYVVARNDELINVGGVKAYPLEIESALLRHPAVLDCVAFALPDCELGQVIGAIVQVANETDIGESQLRAFLAGHLPASKVPTRLWLRTEALRAASGKVNRVTVRERWAHDRQPASAAP